MHSKVFVMVIVIVKVYGAIDAFQQTSGARLWQSSLSHQTFFLCLAFCNSSFGLLAKTVEDLHLTSCRLIYYGTMISHCLRYYITHSGTEIIK